MTNQTATLMIVAIAIAFLVAFYGSLIGPAIEVCVAKILIIWWRFVLVIVVAIEWTGKRLRSMCDSQKADPNGSKHETDTPTS